MPISDEIIPADDYHNRIEAQLEPLKQRISRVISVNNNAIETALRECQYPLRTPANCATCQNSACVAAWEAQEKLWKEDYR